MSSKDLTSYRKSYQAGSLDDFNLPHEPFELFDRWFSEADRDERIEEVNAMTLATASAEGRPRSRVVLLKEYSPKGFVFYTNYESKKGVDLAENPQACLSFFWASLERQVIIEGRVEKLPPEVSEQYFESRPLGSRLGAIISNQSRPIESRMVLESELERLQSIEHLVLKKPDHWGGYCLIPDVVEFWQGRESRLHDRISFHWSNNIWNRQRLAP